MKGLRILAGKYRGQVIHTSHKLSYRPTASRVRKSMFDIIGNLSGKSVADLFAGTGIMGFESASRGAETVVLVENDALTINYLKKNLDRLSFEGINIVDINVFQFLKKNDKFDLIFADPPYGWFSESAGGERIPKLIDSCMRSLKPGGEFILEAPAEFSVSCTDTRKYGDTRLNFWRKKC